MASAGFVLGWKGDEDEEVDIGGSDEEAPGIESAGAIIPAGVESAAARRIQAEDFEAERNKSAPSPSIFRGNERELPLPPGGKQRLENRALNGAPKLGMEAQDNRGCKKEAGAARRAENANGTAASIKGKEPVVEEEDETMAFKKRKVESSSLRDLKRRKDGDWRSSQWVACVLCKKWRRIPFELTVERSTWHCKENVWNSSIASCECPQEEASTFDSMPTMRVDFPNTLCISDGVLRRTSTPLDKSAAPVPDDMTVASETIIGSATDATDRAVSPAENGAAALDVSKSALKTLIPEEGEAVANQDVSPCQVCGLGGQTISCSLTGCASRYHFHCLVPPLTSRPSGGWYCKNHKVESIWLSSAECGNGGQMYYVKWRGRAHLYDSVLSEAVVAKLASKKLTHLKRNGKLLEWQPSWTVPERVIGMRQNDSQEIEWLVKWTQLGYEQSTWESASARFLLEEKGRLLIDVYEKWCEVARLRARAPQADKVSEKCARLIKQPSWLQSVSLQDHQLEMLNNLRDCWCKQKGGIVLSNPIQEEPVPVVAFSISLCREFRTKEPILVVTSPEMLPFWEKKLKEWTLDLNVVMYCGTPNSRYFIRQHEFSLIEGCVKLHIVVTTLDVVGSDVDVDFLKGFKWSCLLIHDSRRARRSIYENLAKVSSSFCLLFCPEPWKWDSEERQLIAEVLGKDKSVDWKELVACQYNAEPVNDLREYWVPAQMSPVQVHQYCLLIVKHFELLRSGNMSQGDNILHELVSVLRDCCSHPYLVSETLAKSVGELVPQEEWLNAGIRASGKLELMHKMLSHFYLNKKKTLIIVQNTRSKQLMNIIDDYLKQQFGSYGRIERGMDAQVRQASLTRFNSQDSSCFALLLERGAATSIPNQLTAVDAVFIYDSDWNPWSDTTCIRKLGLNNVTVYRLYSGLTVEEKILDGAREDVVSNERQLKNLSLKAMQEMLRWGAAALLQMDDWCTQNDAVTDPRIGWNGGTVPNEIGKQLFSLDDDEVKAVSLGNHGTRLSDKARAILSHRDASSKGVPLYGVSSKACEDGNSTAADEFWSPLLKGKREKSLQLQGQRTRKPVEYRDFEDISKRKKRKLTSPSYLAAHGELRQVDASDTVRPTPDASPQVAAPPVSQSSGGRVTTSSSQREEQLERLSSLQGELKSLGEFIELPENVLKRALELLTFVVKNLRMNNNFRHEVQLSLCWIAAEQMGVDFDKVVATLAATSEGFDVDDQSLEAVHNKLKIALGAFPASRSQNGQSPTVAATEKTQPAAVSPRACLDSPPGGCRVSVEKRDLLEEKKQELKTRRKAQTQKLLNSQKRVWCELMENETKQKVHLEKVYEAECRTIQALGTAESSRLLAEKAEEHKLRVKELQTRLDKERRELGERQTFTRNRMGAFFADRLKQLDNGVMPIDITPATDNTAELREYQPESSANLSHQEQQLPRESDDLGRGNSRGVRQQQSPCEQQADPPMIQSEDTPARPRVSSVSMTTAEASHPVLPEAPVPAPEIGSSTREEVSVPAIRSKVTQVHASRNEVPVPNVPASRRQEVQPPSIPASRTTSIAASRREEVPLTRDVAIAASGREEVPLTRDVSIAASGRAEAPAVPAPASRREEVPLPARTVEEVPLASDVVRPPASRSQVPPEIPASRSQQGPATGSRAAVVIALPASRGQEEFPRTTSGRANEIFAGNRSQVVVALPATGQIHAEAPLPLGQSPRVPQQPVSNFVPPARLSSHYDPLSLEETRLQKEMEKIKKARDDEVARLSKELEALKRKLEDECKAFAQKAEALQGNLAAVAAQRRLSEALRLKDSVRLKGSPGPPAPASVWHNSVMDFAAIAGANSRPQALAGSSSPMAAIYNTQHGILRVPGQHFGQQQHPQQVMVFPPPSPTNATRAPDLLRPISPSFATPATQQTHHHTRLQFVPVSASTMMMTSPAVAPPSPTVVATTQELMNARVSSQVMYRNISENLRLSWLNQAHTGTGGGGGSFSNTGVVPAAAVTDVAVDHAAQASASSVARVLAGGNAFIAQHPLDSRVSLGHADYICLSDEE
ncbi:uncharacterized protein LOC9662892 [Selaginella moellendorffii]|uniref:uncharacterized protein LOC9662892 n=1 Tax=Selaginella moellendorffii TaxID=88036 RepID=UPI000D1D010C|nr:uncharacterized protein LOC9662892 [Selaginella moellendorffii]|eukprot:XP_024520221.1 uncharacterized protein LOC9662892 [Selaginella moellendorffii]